MAFNTTRYQVVERDLAGRAWIIDPQTRTRYEITGAGQLAAAKAVFPTAQTNDLTGWNEGPTVVDLYGGPNGIEQVVAGLRPDPLVGQINPEPSAIESISGIGYDPTPTPDAGPAPETTPRNLYEELRARYQFFPRPFLREWANAWAETGDPQLALDQVRQLERYDRWFSGIRREDGSLRMSEEEYVQTRRGYQQVLSEFGIPPSEFERRWGDLIAGEVSAQEFAQRVAQTYEQVLSRGTEIRRFYAENFGAVPSDASILASALEPGTSPLIFEQRFRTAQIGGEFARTGFDLELSEAVRLTEFGLGQEAARKLAQNARLQIPMLQTLVARHNDPDDDLDLTEFLDASAFQDPEQIARFERLLAQEASSFSPTAGGFAREQTGGVSGLVAR